jgi:hypothetical protein
LFSVYFERKVYPFVDCSAIYADLSILFAVEHVFLNVIHSFQVVRGWKLGKIVKNLEQGQKGNSYICYICIFAGLRRKELLQLTWDSVSFQKRELFIKETKTNRSRFVPMNQTVNDELLKLFKKRKDDGLVYVNPSTGEGYVCIRKSFERVCERAKIKGLILHDLRRTFATRLLEAGVDIVSVSELLEHTSITTTQIYCMSSHKSKQNAVARLDPPKSAPSPGDLARIWPGFQNEVTSAQTQKSRSQWN